MILINERSGMENVTIRIIKIFDNNIEKKLIEIDNEFYLLKKIC